MKKIKKNKNLFNHKMFKLIERDDREILQKMSVKTSIKIMEDLLNSNFIEECKKIKKELGIDIKDTNE